VTDSRDPHDTDPLADTQASASPESPAGTRRRSVGTGDTLGRYELVEEIGEGGMATVYRARDKELRREVALKVMFPHLARRDETVRRFHREARAAAGLEHANILRVYDVGGAGETNDPPYIVMELIRGHSLLGEIERRGPMLSEVAACIGALLADALVVAHKAGIIHRDIKPANVMVGDDGRLLLADFGVARLETEDSLVTKTGALLGTPAYMSPEQASGDTATAKSDLYSLGATLYQLVTGVLPYTGSPAKVLALIAAGQYTPAVKKRTQVGPDLSRLFDRCPAREPGARPQSAREVGDELRRISAAGGLGDPADELAAYFADPDAFVRAKTPGIVSALVASGTQALRESKLPRAIAIADRASALAPDDPAVAALVASVTEGGHASRRNRVLALGGIGLLVAGAASFGVMKLVGSPPAATRSDAALEALSDATFPDATAAEAGVPGDAREEDVAIELDAGVIVRRDGGVRVRDAAVATLAVVPADAAAPPPIAVDAAVAVVEAPKPGFVVIHTDAWCDVTIDGTPRGRASTKPLEVAAGPHTVRCVQTSGKGWSMQVTVAPGATAIASGSVLDVEVRFDVDATVNGVSYRRGQVVRMRGGRLDIDGKWVSVTVGCTVRRTPEIGCYP